MTGLVERGAALLVTVSSVARCYIFITLVLCLSSMYENPRIAEVKGIHKRDCVQKHVCV